MTQGTLPFFPQNPQLEALQGNFGDWLSWSDCPYRFKPIFFGNVEPPPPSWIERCAARLAVALLEKGTPLARVIDLIPVGLIAAGLYLAIW